MIRIFQIVDPVLRRRVIEALARRQGVPPRKISQSYEMDDAAFRSLLQELNETEDTKGADSTNGPRK